MPPYYYIILYLSNPPGKNHFSYEKYKTMCCEINVKSITVLYSILITYQYTNDILGLYYRSDNLIKID